MSLSSDCLFGMKKSWNYEEYFTLYDSKLQLIMRHSAPPNTYYAKAHLSLDDSFILAIAKHQTKQIISGYKILTHRAITNNATLEELLALLILEQQKRNKQNFNQLLCAELLQSPNLEIRRITREHYTDTIRRRVSNFILSKI